MAQLNNSCVCVLCDSYNAIVFINYALFLSAGNVDTAGIFLADPESKGQIVAGMLQVSRISSFDYS